MTVGRKHWILAFALAFIAHGAFAALMYLPDDREGAKSAGLGGVEIALGMAGGAAGSPEVAPPEAETVEAAEAQEVTPEAVEQPALQEVAEIQPLEALPETPKVVEEVTPPPVAEQVKIRKKPEPPKPVVETPPVPKPAETKTVEAPKPVEAAPKPAKEVASAPGNAGKSGTQSSSNTGNASSASSGGMPGSSASYFAVLQAWLERHKEYPSSARRRHQEGTAVLSFTMTRDGRILNASIVNGTGYSNLDDEVLKMVRRAAPLPPFPEDFQQAQLTLSVPVAFNLR